MRKIIIALAIAAAVGCSASRERRVCEHGRTLCDADAGDLATCPAQLDELRDSLGDAYGRTLDCGLTARSCAEFAGCFMGGLGAAAHDVERDLERGVDRVMRDDPDLPRDRDPDPDPPRHRDADPDRCTAFEGDRLHASWDGCADHVRREIACKDFAGRLECDCLEDGAETWFFGADHPALDRRDRATRLARSNCRMGFGN
jgi:hypothetical protein